ncbi:hypothetical protein [Saccharothrix syringae]|uniref:Uncharacterized protein n=1 Tax=Saccharothrix syringae TaxID=103733 RepID=A0A5Q0GY08_SACSY|nr:hypothetical protein [Saccharothrix syringae]QFZ18783.1 hypothetical protein EKG83_16185 [Saccharothrix syringae]
MAAGTATATPAPPAAAADPEPEINQAVPGSPPAGLPCTKDPYNKTKMCWQHSGDIIWVINYSSHWGAYGYWWNYYPTDGDFYRQGRCISYLAYNTWGYCNKDMHENSLVKFRSCDDDSEYRLCSAIESART